MNEKEWPNGDGCFMINPNTGEYEWVAGWPLAVPHWERAQHRKWDAEHEQIKAIKETLQIVGIAFTTFLIYIIISFFIGGN